MAFSRITHHASRIALVTCHLSLVTCLLSLSGCIRYDEAIELDANGKGSATLTMSRPKRGIIDKVRVRRFDARFAGEEMKKELPAGITCDHSETERDERIEVKAVYKFDDVNKLIGWAAGKDRDSPLNNLSVTRAGDTLNYTRRFAALEKEDLEAVQKYGGDVPVVFKITGPGKLVSHNGTRAEGNTVIWELKAPDLFKDGGKTLSAEYFFGTPKWIYAAIAGFFLAAIAAAIAYKRKKVAAGETPNPKP